MNAARQIRVAGVVQGVGFRPHVLRLARELNLAGWVRNDSSGVEILAQGSEQRIAQLIDRLRVDAPPRAHIHSMEVTPSAISDVAGFEIRESRVSRCATVIGPDTAVCDACLGELFDPRNRRWRHALITCTHCGPRYTLANSLPYDRARTSMAVFPMCDECRREYTDPADRRYHAEPIACNSCGPTLRFITAGGSGQADIRDAVAAALAILQAGGILAIKGLGGYHLACDARRPEAVQELRRRKQREHKPFALMVANALSAAEWAHVDDDARQLLESIERPVVLVPRRTEAPIHVAPGMSDLGLMLPVTPLQWLLFHEAAGRPEGTDWCAATQALCLVMTSANVSGEPLLTDDQEALDKLAGIADGWLLHERVIVARCDDSVVRAGTPAAGPLIVRRARGYAPLGLPLGADGPTVLALGAHLKSTICITRGAEAFVSPHIGDLDDPETRSSLGAMCHHLERLLEVQPQVIAHDLHPDMYSTMLAQQRATAESLPLLAVQHHHAHVAAVLAEHRCAAPVLGLAIDGVGYGNDGGAWGGELLRVEGHQMTRIGHLAPLPLPGGDRAVREPWRLAAAVLDTLGRGEQIARRFQDQPAAPALQKLLTGSHRFAYTTSLGRYFDAASALLGLASHSHFEGEAAMRLEAMATGKSMPRKNLWTLDGNDLVLWPLFERLAQAALGADAVRDAATMFHDVVAEALAQWLIAAAVRERLDTVVLCGGGLINRKLRSGLLPPLRQAGLQVLQPQVIPPGDAAISLGQAWVARQSLRH